MSDMDTTTPTGQSGQAPGGPSVPERSGGRFAIVMPAVVGAFSLFLLVGALLLDADAAEFPGPRFVPLIVGSAGLALSVILAIGVLRESRAAREAARDEDTGEPEHRTDWVAVGWVVGGFAAFAVLLPWLGWILAAALLFWCSSRGFGSRRPGLDALIALFLSSAIYLIFSTGLGLVLPSGILGGGF